MLIPLGYAQINHKFVGTSVPSGAEVTYGINLENPALSPLAVATVAGQAWLTNIMGGLCQSLTLNSTLVKFGPNDTGPAAEGGPSGNGGQNLNSVPPNVSVLVRKNTNQGGHAGQGRLFVPGVYENNVDASGNLTAGQLEDLQDAFDAFYNDLATSIGTMALLRSEGSVVGSARDVISLSVSGKVATQRRRLRR